MLGETKGGNPQHKKTKDKHKEKQRALLKVWLQKCCNLATLLRRNISTSVYEDKAESFFGFVLLMLVQGAPNLIKEPTRITLKSSSLIDHVVTNTPEKISQSGVLHTGISDHNLVYAIRKNRIFQKADDFVEIRNMKHFNEEKFVNELLNQHWENVYFFGDDPNAMWGNMERIIFRSSKQTYPITTQKN